MSRSNGDRFQILFVCHANLCRSPMAERLGRQAFDGAFGAAGAPVIVSSAGTHALPSFPMHPGSAQVLGEYGINADDFASRALTPSLLAGSDLVLAAARSQRAACVTMVPGTVRRTFTLRQFVRFVAAVPPAGPLSEGTASDRLHALVQEVGNIRHRVQAAPGHEDDLPDPVRQPIEAFRVCAEEIRHAVQIIVGVIAPAWRQP